MKRLAAALILLFSISAPAKDNLNPADYPLTAQVVSTGKSSGSPGALTMPVGSVLTAVPFTTFFAEIKVNDGKTYIVSGSDVQNLQVGEGYSARITDGNRKLEILGKDSKSKLRQWSVVIDKVHE